MEDLLKFWGFQDYYQKFYEEGIDLEAFKLLDENTIQTIFDKAGPRLKFKKKFEEYKATREESFENISKTNFAGSEHSTNSASTYSVDSVDQYTFDIEEELGEALFKRPLTPPSCNETITVTLSPKRLKLSSEDEEYTTVDKSVFPLGSPENCDHIIKILNFGLNDIVTYPIVRIVGRVEAKNPSCKEKDPAATVTLKKLNLERRVPVLQNKFKALVELGEGQNVIDFSYGCRSLEIVLDYSPLISDYKVMPVYVICEGHDGYFQAPSYEKNDVKSACNRILLCSKLLQCFTAEKLYENNLGRKTFSLEKKCQILNSKINYLEARKMTQEQLWQAIGRDIMNSELASEKRKYLAFLSCTKYNGDQFTESLQTHNDLLKITEAYVALGGGGLALFGTACLYTWPEKFDEIILRFEDARAIDKCKFLDDSCYRNTLGSCFSTTLGSALHELYHTFNLGHTENGVMGRGFDNICKFFISTDSHVEPEEVTRSFQDQIEFKEEFEADTLSERLMKEHQKKHFNVIRKYEDDDCTYLTKSCAVILTYHRWFNNYSSNMSYTLTYDSSNKFIRSTGGIRLIEIRRDPDEMILHDWTFEGKVLKFSFRIPDEVFTEKVTSTLFVQDNWGNILKQSMLI